MAEVETACPVPATGVSGRGAAPKLPAPALLDALVTALGSALDHGKQQAGFHGGIEEVVPLDNPARSCYGRRS